MTQAPLTPPRIRFTTWGGACAAILLGLECAKLIALDAGGPAPLAGDAGPYWKLGEQIAQGDFWMRENPVGFRTPGYPWCLGLIRWSCGEWAWRTVCILQHAAVWLVTLITGWWAFRLTGNIGLTNLALGLRLLSLGSASYAGTVLTESLFEPVFLAILMLLTTPPVRSTWRRWLLLGCLFALGFLFRPAILAIAPVIALAACIENSSGVSWRPRLAAAGLRLAIVAVAGLVFVGPWCARNAAIFGRPVPVIFLGRELWMGVFGPGQPVGPPLPQTDFGNRVRSALGELEHNEGWRINWYASNALTTASMNDAEADDLMQKVAWEGIWHDPPRFALRTVWRMVDFWRSVYSRELFLYGDRLTAENIPANQNIWGADNWRQWRAGVLDAALENRLLVMELGSLLGLMGTAGLLLLPQTWRSGTLLLATLLAVGCLSGALDIPNYRLRMILEPVLIVGSIAGWRSWAIVVRRGVTASWPAAT